MNMDVLLNQKEILTLMSPQKLSFLSLGNFFFIKR